MARFADIAVDYPSQSEKTFTYRVPPSIDLKIGHSVLVPFSGQQLVGLVFDLSDNEPGIETREIIELTNPEPVLSPIGIEVARWMSNRYLCSPYIAATAMLPPHLERHTYTIYTPSVIIPEYDLSLLSPQQKLLLAFIQSKGKGTIKDINQVVGKEATEPVINQLLRIGMITKQVALERPKAGPRLVKGLQLTSQEDLNYLRIKLDRLEFSNKEKAIVLLNYLISADQVVALSQVKKDTGVTEGVIKRLLREGILQSVELQVIRDPFRGWHHISSFTEPPKFTYAQSKVWPEINEALEKAVKIGSGFITMP